MAIKSRRPITAGQRGMTTQDFDSITTNKPVKSLVIAKKSKAGRNNMGRITTRHHGGGVKKFYRLVDFQLAPGTIATIEHIEYDPNRSARIARIKDQHGLQHYVLAEASMRTGQQVISGPEVAVEAGNRMPLDKIPTGTFIHSIELQPGKGGQAVRAAGTRAQLLAKEGGYAQVRMPSGEVRSFLLGCTASLGVIGNEQHQNVKLGKAGRKRHLGIRPTVRGVVQNAVDHPHGGGDGGRHGTGKPPRTPWGQLTLGYRTRKRKSTDKMIVRSRHEAKRS
jgi:large subunit ribosomal protein L2